MSGLADVRVHLLLLVVLAVGWIAAGSGPITEAEPTTMDLVLGPAESPPNPKMVHHDEATCPGCIRRRTHEH